MNMHIILERMFASDSVKGIAEGLSVHRNTASDMWRLHTASGDAKRRESRGADNPMQVLLAVLIDFFFVHIDIWVILCSQ